jgi:hypothetical protein
MSPKKSNVTVKQTNVEAIDNERLPKEWTVMVYMAGDNNLSEDMVTQLKGIQSHAGKANVNIVALYDSSYPPVPVTIYDFTQMVTHTKTPVLNDFAVNMNPSSLGEMPSESFGVKKFVRWVLRQNKYKAKRYALILSGHSDGIIGKTILRDENPPLVLDIRQLRKILTKALSFLGNDENGVQKKLDLLGFDGCLMSMLEVGYELKDVAKVMVASEGNLPNSGWSYENILLPLINKEGNLDEKEFAKSIVEEYAKFSFDYIAGGRSVDACACDLEKVADFAETVNRLAKIFLDVLNLPAEPSEETPEVFSNVLVREQFIDLILLSHYYSQTYMHEQAVDILDFIQLVVLQARKKAFEVETFYTMFLQKYEANFVSRAFSESYLSFLIGIKSEFDKIEDHVKNYVLKNCVTGAEYQFSQGVSIFFPWTEMALDLLYSNYKKLKFNKEKKEWLRFIEKYTDLTLRDKNFPQLWLEDEELNQESYLKLVERIREHAGREHAGREHAGRGNLDAFYRFFEQVRNYEHDLKIRKCRD